MGFQWHFSKLARRSSSLILWLCFTIFLLKLSLRKVLMQPSLLSSQKNQQQLMSRIFTRLILLGGGGVYKIISKVLATRLCMVMTDIFSSSQNAFGLKINLGKSKLVPMEVVHNIELLG